LLYVCSSVELLVQDSGNKPLVIEEVPVPDIADDEVLVQVKSAGLCGSDIHLVFEGAPTAFQNRQSNGLLN
jgi:D-arabinose 1-dehydrogenase-like Zn-dependent alcohol dehydrogenase